MQIVLCVLGYTTRESILRIRTKAKIAALEHELLQILSNQTVSENIQKQFPQVQYFLPFPSGLKAVFLQVVQHINNDGKQKDVVSIRDESVRIFLNAKKVIFEQYFYFVKPNTIIL